MQEEIIDKAIKILTKISKKRQQNINLKAVILKKTDHKLFKKYYRIINKIKLDEEE